MNANEIGKEILNQLGGIDRLGAMIGVKHAFTTEHGVDVRFKARAINKANHIKIDLNGLDLYTVAFFRIGRAPMFEVTEIETVDMVPAEALRATIEHATGLALSL